MGGFMGGNDVLPRRRRVVGLAAVAAALLFGPAAVSGTSSPEPGAGGGELRVGMGDALVVLDPHTSGSQTDHQILGNIYEGLTRTNVETGEAEAALAESWEANDDYTQFTFTLRPGVSFHDGSPVTAQDAKWSIDRVVNPDTKATFSSDLAFVESTEATDDSTLVVNLSQPFALLPTILADNVFAAIVPEANGDNLMTTPIGTGPFQWDGMVPQTSVTLTRFADYWDPPTGPAIDSVTFLAIPDANAKIQALLSNQVDLVDTVPSSQVATLQGSDGIRVELFESAWTDYFAMQTQSGPFADPLVRRAVTMAINKPELTELATFGLGQALDTMIVPASPLQVDVTPLAYDPEAARALLAEAGYEDGFAFTFSTCGGTAFPEMITSGQVIAASLAEIGIDATFETTDSGVFANEIFVQHEFDAYVCGLSAFLDPDARTYRYFYTGGSYNAPEYSNPEVDVALDAARQTDDLAERTELYTTAWQLITEDAPWVILFTFPNTLAMSERVQGYVLDPSAFLPLNNVYLTD